MVIDRILATHFPRTCGMLVILFLTGVFFHNTSLAEGIGFGYLHKNGVISDVIYFKDNRWMLEVIDIMDKLPSPHDVIISHWMHAQNDQEDVDCSYKGLEREYLHDYYYHLCHFPKKLSETSAAELAHLLNNIEPNDKTNWKGDHKALFTGELLESMRIWHTDEVYGSTRGMSLGTYAKIFWNESADRLNTWHQVDTKDVMPVTPEFTYIDEGDGDYYCDGMVIKTKTTSKMTIPEGWVSTKNKGYIFKSFRRIADVHMPGNADLNSTSYMPVPKEYEGLFKKMKELWGYKEKAFLTNEQASNPFYFVNILSSEPISEDQRLIYFSAKKFLKQGDSLAIYRGWAVLNKGSDVKWVNVHAAKMDSDYDESLYPIATIAMNNRLFILARFDSSSEKGGGTENEILEFANGTIVLPDGITVRYNGGC